MKIWVDAQLSPILALWINEMFKEFEASSVKALGLRDALDKEIYDRAKKNNAVIISKDYDFIKLINQYGTPPKLIWITSGNTSNAKMKEILQKHLRTAVDLLESESIVEIKDLSD